MRTSVKAAWPAVCQRFEGRCSWMYLDTKGLVTTGTGNLIDSINTAQSLPWLTASKSAATAAEVEAEWRRTKAHSSLAKAGGYAYQKYATLHLAEEAIDDLLFSKTTQFWSTLSKSLPKIESFPADAQLALLDLAWQNGPAFLESWHDTCAALLASDFAKTAALLASFLPAFADRTKFRVRLFKNAADVLRLHLNPDVLWDAQTPTAPATPTPTPEPSVSDIHHNFTYGDYVNFRGGKVPPLVRDVLLAIPSDITIMQGGLSSAVAASAHTHVGLGCYDIGVKGWSKSKITALCEELIRSGECAFPRGPRWGSPSFVEHVHVCSNNCYSQLHAEAKAQVADFKHSPRRNGLVGHAKYVGPSTPLGSWKESPYNPANIREGRGVFYVQTDTLLGLNVNRDQRETKKRGDRISYVRQVKRWGRWNAVTSKGRFFAIADGDQTYLKPEKPVLT